VIHSDTSYLRPRAMFRLMEAHPENEYNYTAYKMLNGESGISFLNIYGSTHLVAYKPIESKQFDLVVFCPENDIMGHYNYMISLMAVVVLLALVAIMVFCWVFIHRELHPLHVLEQSARMIKNGHYYTPIKASKRRDEVGSLTNSFIAMRQGIREHLANIAGNKHKLVEQNKQLSAAHDRIEEANKVKSAFLQNVSDQMIEPVNEISRLVTEVRKHHTEMSQEQIVQLANEVDAHTQTVTNLLTKVLEVSTKKQEGEA
jgi:methyl-accepting chemotaxis protein